MKPLKSGTPTHFFQARKQDFERQRNLPASPSYSGSLLFSSSFENEEASRRLRGRSGLHQNTRPKASPNLSPNKQSTLREKLFQLHASMEGLGTDEKSLFQALSHMEPQDFVDLEYAWYQKFGVEWGPLEEALKGELSFSEERKALAILKQYRSDYIEQASRADSLSAQSSLASLERTLDVETLSRKRKGNRATLLESGSSSFASRMEMIESAQESIHLQTFIFSDDETGKKVADALGRAAERGVDVRVIYDGLGSMRSSNEFFEAMEERGVKVLEYGDPVRKFWNLNQRSHEKIFLVDGQQAILGGMNIADEYAFGGTMRWVMGRGEEPEEPWIDLDVKLEGDVVQDIQRSFLQNWERVGGTWTEEARSKALRPATTDSHSPKDGVNIRFVEHHPDQNNDQHTLQLYLRMIESATTSIRIENAYVIPPKELRKALCDAARRGVDVQILTNGPGSVDLGLVNATGRYYYDEMLQCGIKIFEKEGSTLHSKAAVFDNTHAIVGSMNLNGRSNGLDSESVVLIEDQNTASTLRNRFDSIQKETKAVSLSMLEEEDNWDNLKQWSLSFLSWSI